MNQFVSALLFKYAHYGILLMFLIVLGIGYIVFSTTVNSVINRTVISNAQTVSTALTAFRTLYTKEVVEVVRKEGIEVSHQFQDTKGVIPLPASMSMELGKLITSGPTGASAFLYSPYPFPWRKDGGLNDSFRSDAWEEIGKNPSKPFFRVENYNGVASVRYATADLLRQSCVKCHNTHPQSPKVDWKVGDVRGILEVVQPIGTIQDTLMRQLQTAYFGFSLLFIFAGFGIIGIFFAYRKRIEDNRTLVSHLKINNKTLSVANEELQQFAYRTSHDLKAPLLSIQGLSQYISDDLDDGELDEVKENVTKIDALSKKLEGTIDSIMDLTKADYVNKNFELINLEDMTDDIFESLQVMSDQHRVTLSKNLGHAWDIYSNETRVRQILENLVSNGIKYARDDEEESYVSVTTKTSDDKFIISVIDNGIGIPDDMSDKVFSMFSRFHPKQSSGSGLGLYLVKKHVDALGASISFNTNGGTQFVIQLPKTPQS